MKNLKYLSLLLITLFSNAQRLDLDTLEDVNGNVLTLGAGFQDFDLGNNCILTLGAEILANPSGLTATNLQNGAYDWQYSTNTAIRIFGFINGTADFTLTNQSLNSDSYNVFEGSTVSSDGLVSASQAGGSGVAQFTDNGTTSVSHATVRPPPNIVIISGGRDEITEEREVTQASSANFNFNGSRFLASTGYQEGYTSSTPDSDKRIADARPIPSYYVPQNATLTDSWSITIANHVIPEPSSIILLGLSAFGLLTRRQRR